MREGFPVISGVAFWSGDFRLSQAASDKGITIFKFVITDSHPAGGLIVALTAVAAGLLFAFRFDVLLFHYLLLLSLARLITPIRS